MSLTNMEPRDFVIKIDLMKNFSPQLLSHSVFHATLFLYMCFINAKGFLIWLKLQYMPLSHMALMNMRDYVAFYATNWNCMFQSLFVAIALIYDLLEWTDRHDSSFGKKLKYYRDVLFCGIVTPLTLLVTCMFWSVYAVDRTLVFPVVFDDVVPWWFNHCVHTNITVVLLLETILTARRHPTDPKLERKICAAIIIAYAVVYYSVYLISHRWLYGVSDKMTWWQSCLFQCVIFVSFSIFYVIQFPINRLFHRADDEKPAKVEVQSIKSDDQTNGVVTIEDYTKSSGNETSFLDQPWSLKYRIYNPRDISEKTKL